MISSHSCRLVRFARTQMLPIITLARRTVICTCFMEKAKLNGTVTFLGNGLLYTYQTISIKQCYVSQLVRLRAFQIKFFKSLKIRMKMKNSKVAHVFQNKLNFIKKIS